MLLILLTVYGLHTMYLVEKNKKKFLENKLEELEYRKLEHDCRIDNNLNNFYSIYDLYSLKKEEKSAK